MNRPVRTTILYALVTGLLYLPLAWGLSSHLYTRPFFQLVLWGQLAVYAVLLARWSHTRLVAVLFPLLLLLVAALLPSTYGGFLVLALAIFSWIRSGICFSGSPLRRLFAEMVTVLGALALNAFLIGPSTLSWALGLMLFGLVQALYFFITPTGPGESRPLQSHDPFEQAFEEAQKIVGTH